MRTRSLVVLVLVLWMVGALLVLIGGLLAVFLTGAYFAPDDERARSGIRALSLLLGLSGALLTSLTTAFVSIMRLLGKLGRVVIRFEPAEESIPSEPFV